MTGRQMFDRFRALILIISLVFRFFPDWVLRLIWDFICPFNGFISSGLRYCLLSGLGVQLGANVYIGSSVVIKGYKKLRIGNNVTIHPGCYIDASGGIEIYDNVSIAHATSIISSNHTWDIGVPIKYSPVRYAKVVICEDVWIACGVRVLAGALIESRTVISAGAVVTSGQYCTGVYGGVPARLLRSI